MCSRPRGGRIVIPVRDKLFGLTVMLAPFDGDSKLEGTVDGPRRSRVPWSERLHRYVPCPLRPPRPRPFHAVRLALPVYRAGRGIPATHPRPAPRRRPGYWLLPSRGGPLVGESRDASRPEPERAPACIPTTAPFGRHVDRGRCPEAPPGRRSVRVSGSAW